MKSIGNNDNTITIAKNSENEPHLEITVVVLVHCNIVNGIINKILEIYIHLFLINHLVVCQKLKNIYIYIYNIYIYIYI